MSDWRKRPTLIESWDESIDSILSIDENGTIDLKGVRKNILKVAEDPAHNDRWFTITGVELSRKNFEEFRDNFNSVKYEHWKDGCFDYKSGNKRVVFHSREIRKKEGPFNPKLINYGTLMTDISAAIEGTSFNIYSSSIDKARHIIKYTNPHPVYNLCMEFILERYCRTLKETGSSGILLLESRGKKEDAEVLKYLVNLLEKGNRYWTCEDFSCIKGIYFNPKWSNTHNKKMSFVLLELADLVSYPIHKFVKFGAEDPAYNIIKKKIQNYPYIHGYGLKTFP
ncbi:DUF3800 domain-containing protein [Pseudobacillus badius]|uniref:DUF3800 domain-containing protein n=1 Tax=Bacillus badius TaxID=1455 RepID=UPI0024A4F0B6|nr:DUF3800 domain-containing protein [Bacillus badius]GLY12192.1 hypothetical protein Bbad01_34080 [Bacillus badius]